MEILRNKKGQLGIPAGAKKVVSLIIGGIVVFSIAAATFTDLVDTKDRAAGNSSGFLSTAVTVGFLLLGVGILTAMAGFGGRR